MLGHLLPDFSLPKEQRSHQQRYVQHLIETCQDEASAKALFTEHNERCQLLVNLAACHAEEHPSWDEDDGLPESTAAKQGNNKKKQQTVKRKLEAVSLGDVFEDAGLTTLQGRRLCRAYLKATKKN